MSRFIYKLSIHQTISSQLNEVVRSSSSSRFITVESLLDLERLSGISWKFVNENENWERKQKLGKGKELRTVKQALKVPNFQSRDSVEETVHVRGSSKRTRIGPTRTHNTSNPALCLLCLVFS